MAVVVERASARNVRIDVDLAAVRHNLTEARRLSGGGRLFAVVKADAYGHGAIAVARALSRADLSASARADGFAVVTSGEAMALRDSGVRQPILVLQGPCDPDDAERFAAAGLWPVIHDLEQHRLVPRARAPRRASCLAQGGHRHGPARRAPGRGGGAAASERRHPLARRAQSPRLRRRAGQRPHPRADPSFRRDRRPARPRAQPGQLGRRDRLAVIAITTGGVRG